MRHLLHRGIDETPSLNLTWPHSDGGLQLTVDQRQRIAAGAGEDRGAGLNGDVVAQLLNHQHLLALAQARYQLVQLIVEVAFDDQRAGHAVQQLQGHGPVLVGVIPVGSRAWPM